MKGARQRHVVIFAASLSVGRNPTVSANAFGSTTIFNAGKGEKTMRMFHVLFVCAVIMAVTPTPKSCADGGKDHKKARYLYIWAGDQARTANDFVAVISLDEDSKSYGKVIKTATVPTSNNEAH